MHGAPLGIRRRPVDGGAHEWMAEPHARADLEQAGSRRRVERRPIDLELLRRAPHQRRVTERLGRRDQEQAPGIARQLVEPPQEALLDPARQR